MRCGVMNKRRSFESRKAFSRPNPVALGGDAALGACHAHSFKLPCDLAHRKRVIPESRFGGGRLNCGQLVLPWCIHLQPILRKPNYERHYDRCQTYPGREQMVMGSLTRESGCHQSTSLPPLARTGFKPPLQIQFPRFRHSKPALFEAFSTPLNTADTTERLRGENRSKSSAVPCRPARQNAVNLIVARLRSRALFRPRQPSSALEFFVGEVNAAENSALPSDRKSAVGIAGHDDGFGGFLTPANGQKQG